MANEFEEFLARIPNPFQLENLEDTKAKVQFEITGEDGGQWIADIADNVCKIDKGTTPDPDLTIKAEAEDAKKLLAGELDPFKAYMSGKIKVIGNMMLGLKLLKSIKLG
ncbi:MAG: SCP2 sterol-binding domain-containing protein [Anaerolineaceae bacterium]|jgi:multifunctional beta-oxidation protein